MRSEKFPGLDVTLRVEGDDLREYEDDDIELSEANSKNTVERYVEAVDDANFSVEVRLRHDFCYKRHDLQMSVYVDGVPATSDIIYAKPKERRIRHSCTSVLRCVGKQWQKESFCFARLQTTDGPAKPALKHKLSNLGEVTVKLSRVRIAGHLAQGTGYQPSIQFKVPEKALKGRAISNHVKMSKPERCGTPRWVSAKFPWGKDPFVEFTFKYRSHRDLQVEGIIPRSPSPTPLEDREPRTLEEAQEVIRRQQGQLDDLAIIKREKRGPSALADGVEEAGNANERKRYKTVHEAGVEIIDLSAD